MLNWLELLVIERYFTKPYRFIPPYRSTWWCRLAAPLLPLYLRQLLRIARWKFEGIDALRASLAQGAGILLTANHCRRADPLVISLLGIHLRQFFYYTVAYHQFKQSRLMGWLMHRLGGYSLWREGMDRESLRMSIRLLSEAERPIVLFPEGTWFRQNDRLGPLQEGATLILRQAARLGQHPVVVHPLAIKYWLLEDPRPALHRRLEALESRLSWSPQADIGLVARIEKLASALLAIKECELWSIAQTGTLDERIQRLADAHVSMQEVVLFGKASDGWMLKRIRRLRQILVRQLVEETDAKKIMDARHALHLLVFCENVSANSHDYLRERPSFERLTETVLRIEETLHDDIETAVAPVGVTLAVGPAIEMHRFPATRKPGSDPLLKEIACGIQGLLDRMLASGPPPEWGCPQPVEQASAAWSRRSTVPE